MFSEKMDRSQVFYGNQKAFDEEDKKYWDNATAEEKIRAVTFLRECFYGKTATTGRLQRFYSMSKHK